MAEHLFTSRRFHFVIDAFDCELKFLNNEKFLIDLVKRITKMLKMRILKGPVLAEGVPKNPGISVFAIIDFSHIAIHTFTNPREFCLDIFSCKTFDIEKLEKFIKRTFKLKETQIFKSIVRYDQLEIDRNKKVFPARKYLDEQYKIPSAEIIQTLNWYQKTYSTIKKKSTLLEVAGGPSIFSMIAAAEKVDEITFSDFFAKNLQTAENFSKDKLWNKYIGLALEQEGKTANLKNIVARKKLISAKLKNFIELNAGARDASLTGKFDIIQSNFGLECATDDISEYKRMLKNMSVYMKPRGIFLMVALEGAVASKFDGEYWPAIYLDQGLARKYLNEAGFKIEKIEKIDVKNADKHRGILLIKAVKK